MLPQPESFWPGKKVKIYFLNLNHISKDKKSQKVLRVSRSVKL